MHSSNAFRRRPFTYIVFLFIAILDCYHFLFQKTTSKASILRFFHTSKPELREIPHNLWQIFLGYSSFDGLEDTIQQWVKINQDYSYVLVSAEGAKTFVKEHYSERPHILQTYFEIKFPIFQSDLLRYMLLEARGEVYSDVNTTPNKPMREWISQNLQPYTHAIVGIEYDQLGDPEPSHGLHDRIFFCQWTLASSKDHPLMKNILEKVIKAIHALAKRHRIKVSKLQPTDDELLNITGSAIWTRVVFESLSIAAGFEVIYRNVTGLKASRLFENILVLPINEFETEQPHSGSNRDEDDSALIRHQFKSSWKHGWSNWATLTAHSVSASEQTVLENHVPKCSRTMSWIVDCIVTEHVNLQLAKIFSKQAASTAVLKKLRWSLEI